jgi:2-dehydro-3-deoxyphosphogluconate aldolase/(4S)-4-hydroxy-2-oxoglutarate aldolase
MKISPLEARLVEKRIIPVAVIESLEDAVPLARALADGGIPLIEVTLRTPCAYDCIAEIREECPDILVGAGTVLNRAHVLAVIEAGAQFGVSPGISEDVVFAARERGLFFIPGVMTPSEVELAVALECRLQKFFPAEAAGGVKMLKALAGPYEHTGARFVPLGGISADTMSDYLALPMVAAVGGSWLCEKSLIREKRWPEITALARAALAQASASRPK